MTGWEAAGAIDFDVDPYGEDDIYSEADRMSYVVALPRAGRAGVLAAVQELLAERASTRRV